MTRDEHRDEAQKLLRLAHDINGEAYGVDRLIAAAQVHAILALSAPEQERTAGEVVGAPWETAWRPA